MSESITALLVPVDGSEGSARGARYAAELADLAGATVTLLHILPAADDYDAAEDLLDARRGPFAVACDAMGRSVDEVDHRIAYGEPVAAIMRTAREVEADLIVLGSRGLTPDEDGWSASVSRRILSQAACPVLVVPN
ncbi:MAG: universal stress protein [Deltaproteobacteria bacterium]|nr:MAG: universal stress protein [Deltaproteobacteria bacterium]